MASQQKTDRFSRICVIAILMIVGFWIGYGWPFVQNPEDGRSHLMERMGHRQTTIFLGLIFAIIGSAVGALINRIWIPIRASD